MHQVDKSLRIESANMNVTQCYIEMVSERGNHISSS